MAGRNTKLTPERQKKICDVLRGGNTRRVAAILGGIGERTFYDWLEWANPEHERHDEIYSQFSQAVTRAEAEAEEEHVKNIQLQGIGDWRASVEWLKRRQPKDWSEKQQLDITSDGKALPTAINVNIQSKDGD